MRLYSPEWVEAFNEAVNGLAPEPGVSFRMLQVVGGGPEGTLRITLDVGLDGGGIALGVDRAVARSADADQPAAGTAGVADPAGTFGAAGNPEVARTPDAPGRVPQVTVMVAYEDAVGLARGEVDPAALLRAGRVKVRGDLSALVAGQAILTDAAARLGALSERTTS